MIRRFKAKLRETKGMLCYQIDGTPNYLLISWKVPLFRVRDNELCIHTCGTQLFGRQKKKELFRKYIHKTYKKFSDEIFQVDNNDLRISAAISSG
jgi:hypothetical protein